MRKYTLFCLQVTTGMRQGPKGDGTACYESSIFETLPNSLSNSLCAAATARQTRKQKRHNFTFNAHAMILNTELFF